MRHLDVVAMFGCLWLLASMVLDAVTPNELSVYVIAAALAPATAVTAAVYWLRMPSIDFAVVFATCWMISEMILEMVSPKPLSPMMAVLAVAPMVIVGIVVNVQYWRRPVADPSASMVKLPPSPRQS